MIARLTKLLVRPHWAWLAAAMALLATAWLVLPAQARKPDKTPGAYQPGDEELDLFAAMRSGRLEVKFIPRNARQAKLIIRNPGEAPVNVRLPEVFAARPVLAQQGLGRDRFPVGLQGGDNSGTQAVGAGIGGGINGGNLGQGNFNQGWGFFNVAAGKQAQLKLACVCLEFGKPDPRPSIEYELVELASVCDKPELASVLRALAADECTQTVAQAASWRVASDLSWKEIAALTLRRPAGLSQPMFRDQDLKRAQALVESAESAHVASRQPSKAP